MPLLVHIFMVLYLISLLKYVLWVFGILNMVDDFIFTIFINGVGNTKKMLTF